MDASPVQVLVGNKCDMEESKRKVPYSQGQALADEFGIQFFETSAKNNIKVDEVCGSRQPTTPHGPFLWYKHWVACYSVQLAANMAERPVHVSQT